MSDLIPLAELLAEIDREIKRVPACAATLQRARSIALTIPTIDAEPVVHARWMQDDTLKDLYFCSKCLTRDHRKPKHKFCPDCGARMDADRVDANGDAKERREGIGQ